jgi:hypothetical protein
MAYGDRGLYGEEDYGYVPSGPVVGDPGHDPAMEQQEKIDYYGITDQTTYYGKELPSLNDAYLNSAWKHMLAPKRFSKTYTAGQQLRDNERAPAVGDRGYSMFDNGNAYKGRNQREYESIDKQEQEKIDRWNRYVGNADMYIDAARKNRDQTRRGNALLVGEALEDAMNNAGVRGGKAIREVRPA